MEKPCLLPVEVNRAENYNVNVFFGVIVAMPYHCTVPGCTSNSKTATGVSFHRFQADTALRRAW